MEASMKRSRYATRSVALCVATSSIFTSMMVSAFSQQSSSSLLATAASDRYRYPDGSRLQAQYETINEAISLPSVGPTARAAAAGLGAAAKIQVKMPDGYSLLAGTTSHLPPRAAPTTAATPPGATTPAAADPTEKFITVYPLAYHGIPLSKGSDYLSVVNGEGRLLVTRKRGLPSKVDSIQPSVSAAEAIAVARQSAGQSFARVDPEQTKAELQIWVDDQQNGNLCWTVRLASGSLVEPDVRRYWVSAVGQPRVLNWESDVYHTHNGQVTGNVWATTPLAPTENRPLQQLEVRRATDGATQITGADGRYGYTTGTGSAEIRARLRGPFFILDNQSGPAMEVPKTGTPDNPIDLNFGAANEDQLAEDSAFYWANVARNVARNILGPADSLLAALPVRTNINATCNAFWDGSSINFFKSGAGCPNTAYADVILHEYGHGIDAAKGGILDGGYSEGFGDAVAVLGTRQACVGRDFFGAGTCLRRASDVILWPPAPGEEVHAIGRRFAGFAWELVQQLKQTFAEDDAFDIAARLILGAAAANPADTVDAVRLSFIVDDNDGNLSNGTPHFRSLAAAADSRHIPRPPDPVVAGGAVASSAHFPWTPAKVISTNSNIIQASIHLDRPGRLHVSANTSARSASPVSFTTGVYNGVAPNVMWTDSLREVSVPRPNLWANFGTTFAIDLPAGDHTIYWKLWISGASVTLSAGALLVEGFEPAGPVMTVASAAVTTAPNGEIAGAGAARTPTVVTTTDDAGQSITQRND
jgi:hypothetical protein